MSKSARRRARRLNAFVENVDRRTLYDRDEGVCYLCRSAVKFEDFTIDHVVPLAKGGLHSYANTRCCCEPCNLAKGSSLPADYIPVRKNRRQIYLNQPSLA